MKKSVSHSNPQEKVKVAIRIRPYLDQELPSDEDEDKIVGHDKKMMSVKNGKTVSIFSQKLKKSKAYTFDTVLPEETTQSDLYSSCNISRYINHVVDGYNATIFTYGQTGSGKTFTMEGYKYKINELNNGTQFPEDIPTPVLNNSNDNIGLIPRIISELYSHVGKSELKKHRVY